ncbi:MAG: hypothetical protein K8H88_22330 [Sandaracinaceae bacterium]|nr:hypothetical protein [Sandaracinaceae bacterium]
MVVTTLLASLFRLSAGHRALRSRVLAGLAQRLGLARAQEARELADAIDLAQGRTARLREELSAGAAR